MKDLSSLIPQIDLSRFIRTYQLTEKQLLIGQEIIRGIEWEDHYWWNGTERIKKDNDIQVGFCKNGEMDWLMPIIQAACKDYSDTFGDDTFKGTDRSFVTKISYPGRFNKYEVGCVLDPHYDFVRYIFDGNQKGIPIFSIVVFWNDDYEGGELTFKLGGSREGKEYTPKFKAGDIAIWPSGFLFEHWVTPITSGTRYSLAHWAY